MTANVKYPPSIAERILPAFITQTVYHEKLTFALLT